MTFDLEQEKQVKMAVRGDSTILITGPTGSGKTTLAREIHDQSARRTRPFAAVNLASLHEGTFESELFGHEKGAFTGAAQKRVGRLEQANGGTVFLDEIGELPLRLQARLLEFLQSKSVSPMGSSRMVSLDVRIVCATNRDLASMVRRGEFREDLFHRIRVVAIAMKPLAELSDDFDTIVHNCLERVCRQAGRSILRISEGAAAALECHNWPGNFRELHNVLEYAVLASEAGEITSENFPDWFVKPRQPNDVSKISLNENVFLHGVLAVAEVPLTCDYQGTLADFERVYLEHALKKFKGRISHTARQIGINKATLLRRMHAYNIVIANI